LPFLCFCSPRYLNCSFQMQPIYSLLSLLSLCPQVKAFVDACTLAHLTTRSGANNVYQSKKSFLHLHTARDFPSTSYGLQ
jgi:hypothetical protein